MAMFRAIPVTLAATIAMTFGAALAAPAQSWDEPWSDPRDRPSRLDVSISGGGVAPADWSDLVVLGSLSSVSGALEQVIVRDVRVEPDAVFGGGVTYWRDRFGFRAQAALSRSRLTIGGESLDASTAGRDVLAAKVNSWFYEVGGAIGLIDYAPDRPVWPYVFFGLGGITYDLDRTITPPLLTFIARPGTGTLNDGVIVVDEGDRQFLLAVDELGLETVFSVSFGAGADIRVPLGGGAFGLRLEVSDHLAPSPLNVRIQELRSSGGFNEEDSVGFGTVHHLRATAGIVLQFGR